MLIFLILLVLSLPATSASAQECIEKACIEVYSQGGHIVIEGRKGKGPTSTTTAIPAPSKSARPKKSATAKPTISKKPVAKTPATRKPALRTKRPAVKKTPKARVKRSASAGFSLEDKLIKSIPTAGIAYQPASMPLVRTPVYFWSDIPTLVTKEIEILGELVTISLRPTFFWHYGDGTIYLTRNVGGPYPDGQIRHTYSKPGHYIIELVTRWDGEFTIDGVSAHIPGEITTVSALPITIAAAPTRFTR